MSIGRYKISALAGKAGTDGALRRIISGKKNSFHASKTVCKERIERGKGGGLHLLFFTSFGD
jgi:hypothetical protein